MADSSHVRLLNAVTTKRDLVCCDIPSSLAHVLLNRGTSARLSPDRTSQRRRDESASRPYGEHRLREFITALRASPLSLPVGNGPLSHYVGESPLDETLGLIRRMATKAGIEYHAAKLAELGRAA